MGTYRYKMLKRYNSSILDFANDAMVTRNDGEFGTLYRMLAFLSQISLRVSIMYCTII